MGFNLGNIKQLFGGKTVKESVSKDFKSEQSISTINYSQLQILLSGIKDAVLILSEERRIMVLNEFAVTLLGVQVQSVVGKKLDEVVKLYQSTRDVSDAIYTVSALQNLKLVSSGNVSKDKEIYVNITSVKLAQGLGMGWVVTMHDVSYEREIEEMRTGFVSIAAHELRTPITSIKGYVEAFVDDYKDKLNDDQKQLLEHMKDNADRLAVLVENLLNVSRVERGTLALDLEEIDWDVLVKGLVEDMHERAAEKSIAISYKPSDQKLPNIKADKVRITEVLSNLISNAINYTNPNGKVQIWVELKDNQIVTHVTDNGTGIPADAIPHLFTKFFRVTQGLTQQQYSQGNGLGLYISKAIVEMHKGKIWVESQVGKGSVFSFAIPAT